MRVGRYAQLRLREPVLAARGDRVVLRADTTVGGGVVLDPAPPRRLESRAARAAGARGSGGDRPRQRGRARDGCRASGARTSPPADLARGLASLQQAGDWFFTPEWLEEVRAQVRERLAERARSVPLDPGLPLAELLPPEPWAAAVAPLLHVERRGGKAYAPGAAPTLGDHAAEAAALEERLAAEDLVPVEDRDLAGFLEAQGKLRRVGDGFAVPERLYERGRETLHTLSPITLAGFRDALGVSRRTAQLLLERFDADGLTRRVGDERVLRRSESRR